MDSIVEFLPSLHGYVRFTMGFDNPIDKWCGHERVNGQGEESRDDDVSSLAAFLKGPDGNTESDHINERMQPPEQLEYYCCHALSSPQTSYQCPYGIAGFEFVITHRVLTRSEYFRSLPGVNDAAGVRDVSCIYVAPIGVGVGIGVDGWPGKRTETDIQSFIVCVSSAFRPRYRYRPRRRSGQKNLCDTLMLRRRSEPQIADCNGPNDEGNRFAKGEAAFRILRFDIRYSAVPQSEPATKSHQPISARVSTPRTSAWWTEASASQPGAADAPAHARRVPASGWGEAPGW